MIQFQQATLAPLDGFDATAPSGAIIGIAGENQSGQTQLLRLAAGADAPVSGKVQAPESRRLLGPADALNFAPVGALMLDHTLALQDRVVRARAAVGLDRMRRSGATILIASHDEDFLARWCDEVWWLREGQLAGRGDPAETLRAYREYAAGRLRAWGETLSTELAPSQRRGDGRARLVSIQLLGENGQPTAVWRDGELAVIRLTVRFEQPVADPVFGIMIRTRIGLNVYGTNTEQERLKLGPCTAESSLTVDFGFRCNLCPGDYTLTAASHDPDGVPHDWLDDAVAFAVTGERDTAGVADLRATASISQRSNGV